MGDGHIPKMYVEEEIDIGAIRWNEMTNTWSQEEGKKKTLLPLFNHLHSLTSPNNLSS